jgi:hypothetical protein
VPAAAFDSRTKFAVDRQPRILSANPVHFAVFQMFDRNPGNRPITPSCLESIEKICTGASNLTFIFHMSW